MTWWRVCGAENHLKCEILPADRVGLPLPSFSSPPLDWHNSLNVVVGKMFRVIFHCPPQTHHKTKWNPCCSMEWCWMWCGGAYCVVMPHKLCSPWNVKVQNGVECKSMAVRIHHAPQRTTHTHTHTRTYTRTIGSSEQDTHLHSHTHQHTHTHTHTLIYTQPNTSTSVVNLLKQQFFS